MFVLIVYIVNGDWFFFVEVLGDMDVIKLGVNMCCFTLVNIW